MSAVIVLLVLAALLSGCVLQLPSDRGPVRICYPANHWRCHPSAEWSDM